MNQRAAGHRPRLFAEHERDLYDWNVLCAFPQHSNIIRIFCLTMFPPSLFFDTDLRPADLGYVCGDNCAVLSAFGRLDIVFMKMAQVTRHLSPYEQQIVMPFLRTFPKRAYEKFMGSFVYWGGAAVLTLGTASLSDSLDAAQDREHRF